jgi:hypothetical protein
MGKGLYSWRVLILPFVDEDQLFREFRLKEPWDSPHNIRLLERMPRTFNGYKALSDKRPGHTYYRVFIGKGTAFGDPRGSRFEDFSNTIMIVEAGEAVPWTKPEELVYAPNMPVPPLGGIARDGSFGAALGDGTVRFIRPGLSDATLRAAIAGG